MSTDGDNVFSSADGDQETALALAHCSRRKEWILMSRQIQVFLYTWVKMKLRNLLFLKRNFYWPFVFVVGKNCIKIINIFGLFVVEWSFIFLYICLNGACFRFYLVSISVFRTNVELFVAASYGKIVQWFQMSANINITYR